MSDKMERDTAVIVGLLRDSYQDTKAENKRLKEEAEQLRKRLQLVAADRKCIYDSAIMLKAENSKLWECVQEFADLIRNDDGFGVDQGWMLDRLRELGIEVDK